MTFLAGLELTRRGLLFLRQTQPFSELWIYRRADPPGLESSDDEAAEAPESPEARETNDEGVDA
jgi:chromatin segregation and condensation protein Rec8/ScpA/Scc1 (kleisin family)